MLRILNFLRNSIINFRMYLYFVTCFLRVTVSLLCRLEAVSKIHVPIYAYLISERKRNCSTWWPAQQQNRDSNWSNFRYYISDESLILLRRAPWSIIGSYNSPILHSHSLRAHSAVNDEIVMVYLHSNRKKPFPVNVIQSKVMNSHHFC